ncbi:hypothetical protein [Halobacillus seohaensis]|uniref:Uncharacterized protein n=1 Tax=Halobacillus seohaensis TaxID=447421 RepID=A0ABW2EKN4_9BACI
MKFIEKQWVDSTLKGNLFFNIAKYYIELEKINGKGIGDSKEGSFSKYINPKNEQMYISLDEKKWHEIPFEKACSHTRMEHLDNTPMCCFVFLSHKKDFVYDGEMYVLKENVADELLEEFGNHEVFIVAKPKEFFNKIHSYANDNGFKSFEGVVQYYDPMKEDFPMTLSEYRIKPLKAFLYKRTEFKNQREVRVVFNTSWGKGRTIYLGNLEGHLSKLSKEELIGMNSEKEVIEDFIKSYS